MAARSEISSSGLCFEMKSLAMFAQLIHRIDTMENSIILINCLHSKGVLHRRRRHVHLCPGVTCTLTDCHIYMDNPLNLLYTSIDAFIHSQFQLAENACRIM